jgi:hypothetical protein
MPWLIAYHPPKGYSRTFSSIIIPIFRAHQTLFVARPTKSPALSIHTVIASKLRPSETAKARTSSRSREYRQTNPLIRVAASAAQTVVLALIWLGWPISVHAALLAIHDGHTMFQAGLGVTQSGSNNSTEATSRAKSDPQAVAVVEGAIAAMGGRSVWQEVGGATAHAVITPKYTPVRAVTWSDDWSKGRVRFRRDSAANESSKSSLIGSDASQVHLTPNGKNEFIPHDNGIAVLALSYPAPALILSLSKYQCTFHLGKTANRRIVPKDEDPSEVTVTERCPDPFYPGGAAILTWVFSKGSRTPKSVELPIWGISNHLIRTQTVSYIAFQNVQGRLVPSQLEIRRVTGAVDQLSVSDTVFVQSISDQTFKTSN